MGKYDEIEILHVEKSKSRNLAKVIYRVPEEYSDESYPVQKEMKVGRHQLEKVELEDGTVIREFERKLYEEYVNPEDGMDEETKTVAEKVEEVRKECKGKKLSKDDSVETVTKKSEKRKEEKRDRLTKQKAENSNFEEINLDDSQS